MSLWPQGWPEGFFDRLFAGGLRVHASAGTVADSLQGLLNMWGGGGIQEGQGRAIWIIAGDAPLPAAAQADHVCVLRVGGAAQSPAEDVLIPPVRAGVLIAHIRSIAAYHAYSLGLPAQIPLGDLMFVHAHRLIHKPKVLHPVRLTPSERDVLLYLCAHAGEDIDRATLLQRIWGYADTAQTHTLETHIYRLRQKIEPDPANPVVIRTGARGYFVEKFS